MIGRLVDPPRELTALAVPCGPDDTHRLDVLLTWEHDGAGVAWFEVDRQLDGEGWKIHTRMIPRWARGGQDGTANALRDMEAPYGREVRYRCVAIGEDGTRSPWSSIAATEPHAVAASDHPAGG